HEVAVARGDELALLEAELAVGLEGADSHATAVPVEGLELDQVIDRDGTQRAAHRLRRRGHGVLAQHTNVAIVLRALAAREAQIDFIEDCNAVAYRARDVVRSDGAEARCDGIETSFELHWRQSLEFRGIEAQLVPRGR